MRAVVDTNSFVRALIKPEGTVRAILERLLDQTYTPLYSESMLEELRIVFGRPRILVKYGLAEAETDGLLQAIVRDGEAVSPTRRITVCRDPTAVFVAVEPLAEGLLLSLSRR
jgi:putative PIN family toxin of toxin-antitoxin system